MQNYKLNWFENDIPDETFTVFEFNNTPVRCVLRKELGLDNQTKWSLYAGKGKIVTEDYISKYCSTHTDWGISDIQRMIQEGVHFPKLKKCGQFNTIEEGKDFVLDRVNFLTNTKVEMVKEEHVEEQQEVKEPEVAIVPDTDVQSFEAKDEVNKEESKVRENTNVLVLPDFKPLVVVNDISNKEESPLEYYTLDDMIDTGTKSVEEVNNQKEQTDTFFNETMAGILGEDFNPNQNQEEEQSNEYLNFLKENVLPQEQPVEISDAIPLEPLAFKNIQEVANDIPKFFKERELRNAEEVVQKETKEVSIEELEEVSQKLIKENQKAYEELTQVLNEPRPNLEEQKQQLLETYEKGRKELEQKVENKLASMPKYNHELLPENLKPAGGYDFSERSTEAARQLLYGKESSDEEVKETGRQSVLKYLDWCREYDAQRKTSDITKDELIEHNKKVKSLENSFNQVMSRIEEAQRNLDDVL